MNLTCLICATRFTHPADKAGPKPFYCTPACAHTAREERRLAKAAEKRAKHVAEAQARRAAILARLNAA